MENSAFGRLLGVLIAPGKTFRSIAERPTWLVAFLVVSLSPLLPAVLAVPKMDWEGMAKANLERMDIQIPQDQLDKQVAMMERVGPFFAYCSPLFLALGLLLIALVFWGALTLVGGESGFRRSLAVVSHGQMPLVVGALLSVPIILGMNKIGADVMESGSYLKSNLAAWAPEGAGMLLTTLLSKIDVFTIWSLVLFAIGFRWCAKVSQRTAALTVFGLWLVIWVGGSVGFAALGKVFGGRHG